MIGIFDSGVGGMNSYRALRKLLPKEDIIYLADRQNAPYGTKNRDTIIKLVKRNILRLRSYGASDVLIACCTASSVYGMLDVEEQAISTPIIPSAAKDATDHGDRITVISTTLTATSHAFKREIHLINPLAEVSEIPTQILVSLVELGAKDGELLPRESDLLDKISLRIQDTRPDSLILGCTHFSCLRAELATRLPGIHITDAAAIGAEYLARKYRQNQDTCKGFGKNVYAEGRADIIECN